MIERQILIGLITSTEFHTRIKDKWTPALLESPTAKRIATWCKEYFDKYNKAPGRAIEPIFYDKAKNGLSKDIAEEIEEDILPSLSQEFEEEPINVDYLTEKALKHFSERNLLRYSDDIRALVETGKTTEAEALASGFKPLAKDAGNWIDMADIGVLDKLKMAFDRSAETLIRYPGALGELLNSQLVRGAFVAFMGSEKRGKTWTLLELAMRACRQGRKVAFFQAGDMSDLEQMVRMAVYLTKRSNKEEFSGKMMEPCKDCILNQNNTCTKKVRECNFGPFEGKPPKYLRKEVTIEEIMEAYQNNKEYRPCHNCKDFARNPWGCTWVTPVDTGDPITYIEAQKAYKDFFIKNNKSFKLASYPTDTLSVDESLSVMEIWEKQDNFIPDIIIYDYPDIMVDPHTREERQRQNNIWKGLRGVSQKRKALVIVVTQADADSYDRDLITKKNFSEDKRKYGHVTAFYGLNQDSDDREKALGIMRINQLVIREGDFSVKRQVHLLQNLRRGRPFLTSYW